MKARDLAALAALGIAGKYAYDKYSGKKEPKSKGTLGEAQSANDSDAGEFEARMSKRDMNEGSGRRDAGGDADYQMPRTAPRTVPEDYDAPRTAPRQPVAVAKPAVSRSVAAAPAADAVADDYVMPRTAQSPNAQAQARLLRQGTRPAQSPNAQARLLRQGTQPAQSPNAQAQARMLRQGAPATQYAKGGMTSSKSTGASRGDGIAQRGKTRGKYL